MIRAGQRLKILMAINLTVKKINCSYLVLILKLLLHYPVHISGNHKD